MRSDGACASIQSQARLQRTDLQSLFVGQRGQFPLRSGFREYFELRYVLQVKVLRRRGRKRQCGRKRHCGRECRGKACPQQ